jgi:hypothetical protein
MGEAGTNAGSVEQRHSLEAEMPRPLTPCRLWQSSRVRCGFPATLERIDGPVPRVMPDSPSLAQATTWAAREGACSGRSNRVQFTASSLKGKVHSYTRHSNFPRGSDRAMPSESLHDTPSPQNLLNAEENCPAEDAATEKVAKLPAELSEFSQRLASFGLGEVPDPLLTESRPSGKHRRGN